MASSYMWSIIFYAVNYDEFIRRKYTHYYITSSAVDFRISVILFTMYCTFAMLVYAVDNESVNNILPSACSNVNECMLKDAKYNCFIILSLVPVFFFCVQCLWEFPIVAKRCLFAVSYGLLLFFFCGRLCVF